MVGEWVYGIKFDFGSAGSTVVRDRPGLSYGIELGFMWDQVFERQLFINEIALTTTV